jgi:hypothetical protein
MSDIGFSEKDFVEVLEYLNRLRSLAELARKFHSEGLSRDELKHLLDLLKQAIEYSTKKAI